MNDGHNDILHDPNNTAVGNMPISFSTSDGTITEYNPIIDNGNGSDGGSLGVDDNTLPENSQDNETNNIDGEVDGETGALDGITEDIQAILGYIDSVSGNTLTGDTYTEINYHIEIDLEPIETKLQEISNQLTTANLQMTTVVFVMLVTFAFKSIKSSFRKAGSKDG